MVRPREERAQPRPIQTERQRKVVLCLEPPSMGKAVPISLLIVEYKERESDASTAD